MPKQLNITELDFDQIKQTIKDYYKRDNSQFKDWNFEGSGLNILLDVLAYNTHYNAMLAHLAANEGFLTSAQLRKNVVARAKTLGYIPHSMTAAATTITLGGADIDDLSEVPRGTTFSTKVGGTSYTFTTTSSQDGPFNSSESDYNTVIAYQGKLKTINYIFDGSADRQVFQIPDANVDISQLRVTSYPPNSSTSKNYFRFTTKALGGSVGTVELGNALSDTAVYFISENPNGLYEVEFGNDVIGVKPQSGSTIELSYLITDGELANGASSFTLTSTLVDSDDTTLDNISVESATISTGGGTRENIEQIRTNAPLAFIAQDRAVTANDYKSIILNNTSADYVSVWGGEDLTPPQLGTVFIAARGEGGDLTQVEQQELEEIFSTKGVLTLRHEFVASEMLYLYFNVFCKYNPNLTNLSAATLATTIKNNIDAFDAANLADFFSIFRHSKFLSYIDNSNASILNSIAKVHAYKILSRSSTTSGASVLDFTFAIDQDENITTDSYTYDGTEYYFESYGDIATLEIDSDTQILEGKYLRRFYYDENDVKQISDTNAGTVNYQTGVITFDAFTVDSTVEFNVYARPASDNIVAKRNNIIEFDINKTTVQVTQDNIALLGNAGAAYYNTIPRD